MQPPAPDCKLFTQKFVDEERERLIFYHLRLVRIACSNARNSRGEYILQYIREGKEHLDRAEELAKTLPLDKSLNGVI